MPDADEIIPRALAAAKTMADSTRELDLEGQPYAPVQMLYAAREVFEHALEELGLA